MTTPNAGGKRSQVFGRGSPRFPQLWWCVEGMLAAGIAALVTLVSYSALAELTVVLGLLSSTGIAFLVILVWISAWGTIATTRMHVRGRQTA